MLGSVRVGLSVVRVLGLVLGLVQSLETKFDLGYASSLDGSRRRCSGCRHAQRY